MKKHLRFQFIRCWSLIEARDLHAIACNKIRLCTPSSREKNSANVPSLRSNTRNENQNNAATTMRRQHCNDGITSNKCICSAAGECIAIWS